jgi:hypothetical protein
MGYTAFFLLFLLGVLFWGNFKKNWTIEEKKCVKKNCSLKRFTHSFKSPEIINFHQNLVWKIAK